MYISIILGTAGSGKSALAKALADYLDEKEADHAILNLDPGTLEENLPYKPDINIRDYVKAEEVMQEYKLGPNGAMIASMDLTIRYLRELRSEILDFDPEYLIIDTPGQMEIFAYRPVGSIILKELLNLPDARTSLVFIFDPYLCTVSPNTLLSVIFLSISVLWRFNLPQVNVLSKIDLFDQETIEKIVRLVQNPSEIFADIYEFPLRSELGGIIDFLKTENMYSIDIVPVSAVTGEGIMDLFSMLLNNWSETG